jgi:hypothetical protein
MCRSAWKHTGQNMLKTGVGSSDLCLTPSVTANGLVSDAPFAMYLDMRDCR